MPQVSPQSWLSSFVYLLLVFFLIISSMFWSFSYSYIFDLSTKNIILSLKSYIW